MFKSGESAGPVFALESSSRIVIEELEILLQPIDLSFLPFLPLDLCNQHIDLVFALESSGRIAEHHETIKSFTENVINTFDIGARKTHVGVVTFGDFADLQIKLTDNYDKNTLIKKVQLILKLNAMLHIEDEGFRIILAILTNLNDPL